MKYNVFYCEIVGSNRSRIFADGKPNSNSIKWAEVRSITPIMNGAGIVSSSPMPTDTGGDVSDSFVSIVNSQSNNVNSELMPERLSPDGADEGEAPQLTNEQIDDEDAWSDWETDQQLNESQQSEQTILESNEDSRKNEIPNFQRNMSVSSSTSTTTNPNNDSFIKDIKEIDIKLNSKQLNDEIDFFKDMEPVIAMPSYNPTILIDADTNKLTMNESKQKINNENKSNVDRFAVTSVENDTIDEAAWGDEVNDWDS